MSERLEFTPAFQAALDRARHAPVQDYDEEDCDPGCTVCGGVQEVMGTLGRLTYGRCRDCGTVEEVEPVELEV